MIVGTYDEQDIDEKVSKWKTHRKVRARLERM